MTRRNLNLLLAGLIMGLTTVGALAQAVQGLGRLPLYFAGQPSRDGIPRFLASGPDSQVLIAPGAVQLYLRNQVAVQAEMLGASPQATLHGEAELAGKVNYLTGNGAPPWRTAVPMFARVRVDNLYPGISAVYHGNQVRLEYDFDVAPGARPDLIQLRFTGTDKIAVNDQGELDLFAGAGEIRQPKPLIYQIVAGVRHEVAGGFRLVDARTVAFVVGAYDHAQPLVIDPILNYSTYFGGNSGDVAQAVAVNTNDGSIFVAGYTLSTTSPKGGNFSTTNAFQKTFRGGSLLGDAFVAKFDTNFNLIYLTYLGGSADDAAVALAVDKAGHAFVGGYTDSPDFPITNRIAGLVGVPGLTNHIGGVINPYTGGYMLDGFVAELETNGSSLIYSTYLGGNLEDAVQGLAIDSAGSVYVTGYTLSTNFPATNAVPYQLAGNTNKYYLNYLACSNTYFTYNGFIAKIAPQGTNLDFSTYFGGNYQDAGTAIALDSAGDIYVAGYTASTNFPNTNAFQEYLNQSTNITTLSDAFIAKLAPSGNTYHLLYSTFLGNTNNEQASGIAVDSSGAYVTGWTVSTNFYNTAGTNVILNGVTNNVLGYPYTTNVFLTKIVTTNLSNVNTSSIAYSVVFGGLYRDVGTGVAVDSKGNAFVVGSTISLTFPTTNGFGLLHTNENGWNDCFITAFNTNCSAVLYSVCLGGTYYDYGNAIAVDQNSSVYVAGQTLSANFPVTTAVTNFPTENAWSPTLDGSSDAFLSKIQLNFAPNLTVVPVQKTNEVSLSWLYSTNIDSRMAWYILQSSTNLLKTNWFNLTNGVTVSNNLKTITLPATNPAQFFRLFNTN